MKKKFIILITALMLLVFMTPSMAGWGQTRTDGDTHEFSQSLSQLLNNNASIPSINIAEQSYPVKKVTVVGSYNKSYNPAVTIAVSVGGTSWGTQQIGGSGSFSKDFTGTSTVGAIVISFTNETGSGTGHGTFNVTKVTLTEGSSGPAPTYTVTLGDDNTELTQASAGASVTLPERGDVDPYSFEGWSETDVEDETTTAPTIIPAGNYTPTADITLYPVYTRTTAASGPTNVTANVTIADYASAHGWVSGTAYQPLEMDANISIGGTISGNNFKYYSSDNSWRFYTGGSFTISANNGATLSSVTLTFSGGLSYNNNDITSGTAFNVSGTSATISCTANAKITVISVSYTITGGTTTYYWSWPVIYTDPIINATNPEALAYNATGGEFGYSITNPTGASLNAASNSDWITNVAVDGENSKVTFSTSTNTAYTQRVGTITLTYTGATDKVITITQNAAPTPTITAADVNIEYNATDGSIAYTINNEPNPAGTLTAAIKAGTTPTIADFAVGTVANGAVPFTCSANTTSSAHTATVTLTYTYGDNQTTTKDVVVTQAGNPDAFDNISSINSENTEYSVRGTVLAVSARGFVLGDGTGYVYYYNGYSAPSVSVGDKKIVQGTTTSYGHVIQFPSSATITATGTSNYNNTPAATVITEIPDYTSGLHLSDYFQFEGTLTKSNGYYYVSCGANNINISYPSSTQQTTMNALENKTVRVKGYFAGINSSNYFTVILESVEEVVNPVLSIEPATAADFTYVVGNGPSAEQVFEVTGTNLTSADITAAITAGTSYFEITDDTEYSSSVTIASGDAISIRLKAGLAKGSYVGTVTLSSTDAQDVVVNLSGSVTGQTYSIVLMQPETGGTIASDMETAEAGATVTLTATPDAAYNFSAWMVLKDDQTTEVTVTNNQFTMPACQVYVTAEFTAKPTNAITCVANPTIGGEIEASPASAYEGQTVTLSYLAETGYTFSEIVITKTSDGSTTGITPTASGDDYTFTMPGYAVTATATFLSDTYTGSFVKFTGSAMEEGDYILVYNNKAMNNDNTTTSNKLGATDVNTSTNIITNPSRSIVWHIAPIGTDGKWTIYNAVVNQYVNAAKSDNTNLTLVDNASWSSGAKWSVTIDGNDNTYDFSSLTTSRALRYYENSEVFGHYATSNGGPFTLYKYTELTERTITFDGNGGETENEETTYTQTVYDGVATNLDPNQFTFGSSIFMGWSTTQDGEVEYADEAPITVTGDVTLYAKWETGYTAMVDDEIVGGSVYIVTATGNEETIEAAAGTEITLTYTADLGYAFSAWNVYYSDENEQVVPVEVNDDKFTMPAYDVTISAGFEKVTTYSLVTNIDQIVSGKHYIIVGKKNNVVKAMGYDKGNNRHAVEVSETNSTIAKTDGVYEFVINGPIVIDETNYYTIYDTNEESTGYLYAPNTSGKNYLKTQTVNDNKGQWTIGIAATSSVATIVANVSDRNTMQYNEANAIFSCYSSASQQDVYLYVKVNDNDLEYYGTEINYAQDEIPAGETITVGTGSVMTVPSTFTNTNSANLVIEDGGQLIHDNPVSATIQRNITGYGRSNPSGYQFIASPVKDDLIVDETNLTTSGSYDLYIFDQSQPSKEWRNYKANEFTTIGNGVGYLYANTTNITISFSGELKPSDNDVPVTLAYTDGNRCAGWNLIGNPFACKAYITDATGDIEAFYRMNGNGDGYDAVVGAINPMEGIFVQANDIDQYFYFTRTAPVATPGKGNLNLEIAQVVTNRDARQATDNAIIRFDGGNTLEKFSFSEDNAKLYIPQNGKDYAVVSAEAQGEMPVNFKAEEDGTYTISFNTENVKFGYLHLIDNKTGNDIDLLQTSSYTFEASRIDYASRFRLVFSAIGNENDSENNDFGFFDANGNFLILGNEGTATLQVIDITGRTVSNETFSGNYSKAINAKAGVYMLRLIQGNDVRTQKIVVK